MTSRSVQHRQSTNLGVHLWAWALVCATFPLIWVGGLVTTTDSGMAFRDWLTSDGTFFLCYDWLSSAGDKFIEHGHRLLGAAAGFLSIGLVIATFRSETRAWVKKWSLAMLAAVLLQGVLGGARVLLDERTLALVHGCTGPLFFTLCVAMVVFTSRRWQTASPQAKSTATQKTFRLAILCACLAYAQLVVGAVVRHSPHLLASWSGSLFQAAVYFHLLLALMLVGHVLLLAWRCLQNHWQRRAAFGLLGLVGLQLLLGMATWLVKYGMPVWATAWLGESTFVSREADALQAAIITSHVAVGSLILVFATAMALQMGRALGVGGLQGANAPVLPQSSLLEGSR